jgi:murein DD-endopeptidase MepM/ murein hydrolase activator NlpD
MSAETLATFQTAVTSAHTALEAAQKNLDEASADYSSARDAYAAAGALSDAADAAAERTRLAAEAAAAKLMVTLHQTHTEQAATTLGAVLGSAGASPSGNLLDRLTAATELGQLNGPIDTLAARATATAKHAKAAAARAREDRAAIDAIPLEQKRATMDQAQSAVDAAKASVEAAVKAMVLATSSGVNLGFVDDPKLAPGTWADPVRGPITDVFGPRPSQPAGTPVFHPGDDIGAACMTVVVAAADGVVSYAGAYGGYGNFILIDHGGGVQTAYGHLSDKTILVAPGEHVSAGQPIARAGSTGESTGCHLHIEVRANGTAIDPMPFFANRGVSLGR